MKKSKNETLGMPAMSEELKRHMITFVKLFSCPDDRKIVVDLIRSGKTADEVAKAGGYDKHDIIACEIVEGIAVPRAYSESKDPDDVLGSEIGSKYKYRNFRYRDDGFISYNDALYGTADTINHIVNDANSQMPELSDQFKEIFIFWTMKTTGMFSIDKIANLYGKLNAQELSKKFDALEKKHLRLRKEHRLFLEKKRNAEEKYHHCSATYGAFAELYRYATLSDDDIAHNGGYKISKSDVMNILPINEEEYKKYSAKYELRKGLTDLSDDTKKIDSWLVMDLQEFGKKYSKKYILREVIPEDIAVEESVIKEHLSLTGPMVELKLLFFFKSLNLSDDRKKAIKDTYISASYYEALGVLNKWQKEDNNNMTETATIDEPIDELESENEPDVSEQEQKTEPTGRHRYKITLDEEKANELFSQYAKGEHTIFRLAEENNIEVGQLRQLFYEIRHSTLSDEDDMKLSKELRKRSNRCRTLNEFAMVYVKVLDGMSDLDAMDELWLSRSIYEKWVKEFNAAVDSGEISLDEHIANIDNDKSDEEETTSEESIVKDISETDDVKEKYADYSAYFDIDLSDVGKGHKTTTVANRKPIVKVKCYCDYSGPEKVYANAAMYDALVNCYREDICNYPIDPNSVEICMILEDDSYEFQSVLAFIEACKELGVTLSIRFSVNSDEGYIIVSNPDNIDTKIASMFTEDSEVILVDCDMDEMCSNVTSVHSVIIDAYVDDPAIHKRTRFVTISEDVAREIYGEAILATIGYKGRCTISLYSTSDNGRGMVSDNKYPLATYKNHQ